MKQLFIFSISYTRKTINDQMLDRKKNFDSHFYLFIYLVQNKIHELELEHWKPLRCTVEKRFSLFIYLIYFRNIIIIRMCVLVLCVVCYLLQQFNYERSSKKIFSQPPIAAEETSCVNQKYTLF